MHTSACKGEHVMVVYFYISAFYNALSSEVLSVPQLNARPGSDTSVPYVLVADDGFPLNSYLIKAYAGEVTKGSPKRVFNTLRTGPFKLFKLFKRPFPGFLTILTL